MELIAIKSTELLTANSDLLSVLLDSLKMAGQAELQEGDIVAISAKVVAITEGRTAPEQQFADLVKEEADRVYPSRYADLTITNGIPIPNAGIDRSNSQSGQVILWPADPQKSVDVLWQGLGGRAGVMLIDSCCWPLRKGTNALCLAYRGFKGVEDHRGEADLHGRQLTITQVAMADQLAAASNLLMGEAAAMVPFVLIKNAPVQFSVEAIDSVKEQQMPIDECVWGPLLS